jgi:hypothetical protein
VSDIRPWPVAPRPFPSEALGSWLGRVAALYRMSIHQLVEQYRIEIDFGSSNLGWLLLPHQPRQRLDHLAKLARLGQDALEVLQTPPGWSLSRSSAPYCHRCLCLNPLDVTSPFWPLHWLAPVVEPCGVHPEPLRHIQPSSMRTSKNLGYVINSIQRGTLYGEGGGGGLPPSDNYLMRWYGLRGHSSN